MNKILILLFALLGSCNLLFAEISMSGNVKNTDGTISFQINNPDFKGNGNSVVKIITYSYNLQNDHPKISEWTKFFSNGSPITIENAPECEFIILQAFPEKRSSINAMEVMPIIVHNSANTPIRNSYYLKSLFEINALSDFNNPNLNYPQSLGDIQKELQNYPNNIIAKLSEISMNKQGSIDLQKVKNLCPNPENLSEKELILLNSIYNSENQKTSAEEISKIILRKYPLGTFSEQNFYTSLSKKKNNDYIEMAMLFIQQYPNSSKKSEIVDKIAQIYIENNDLNAAKSILERHNYIPPYQSLRLAFAFLEKRNNKKEAENMFGAIITRLKNKDNITPSNFISDYQWNNDINNYLAETYRAFGEYYLQVREPQKALDYFLLAISTFEVAPAKLYENLAIAYYNNRLDRDALQATEQAFMKGHDTKVIRDINERVYNTLYRNREYNKYSDSLNYAAKIERQNQLENKLINADIKLPILRNIDNIMIDISLLKRDILVIELFASWCKPCESSLLSFAEINKSLKKDANIAMITVNTFENDKLDQKIFKIDDLSGLQIYFDDSGDFARSLGVSGLPVRLFFDKYGKCRYIQSGAIGKAEDIRETKDVMELINSMQ